MRISTGKKKGMRAGRTGAKTHPLKRISPDLASYRESIVNSVWAGLLTCNIFAVLPAPNLEQWTSMGKNLLCYLQLRDSP